MTNTRWHFIRAQIHVVKDKSAMISPMWLVTSLIIPMSTTLLKMLRKPSSFTPSHVVSPSYLSSSLSAQIVSVSCSPLLLLSWHSSSPSSRWSSTLLSLDLSNMKSIRIPVRTQTSQPLSGWCWQPRSSCSSQHLWCASLAALTGGGCGIGSIRRGQWVKRGGGIGRKKGISVLIDLRVMICI